MFKPPLWVLLGIQLSALAPALAGEELPAADLSASRVIDQLVESRLREAGVEPAPLLGPAALLRRTSLDLIGRVPTLAELRAYLAADPASRREALVDRLLEDPAFVAHQARELNRRITSGRGDLNEYRIVAAISGRVSRRIQSRPIRGLCRAEIGF